MPILSIDTSTKNCSVAIHQDGKLLAISELYSEKSSSGMLTTLIQNVVKYANLTLKDLDAIAIAKGPGSYTGLRIGVSTAKGLCYTLDKPLIAVNSLEAMAYQLKDFVDADYLLCPMIDARRMEVYCAIYRASSLYEIEATQAKIIDENSFDELLRLNGIVFFGDGAEKCKNILQEVSGNAFFLDTEIHPSARTVGYLATQLFKQNQFENLADFEPFYLKDFITTTPRKQIL
jgi:tRNA threonylcarbamoyladenosine biosynthesis protein TsaB